MSGKLHINAESHAEEGRPQTTSSSSLTYILLALRYLSVLAGILQGLATGNLDQTVTDVHVGGDVYDGEVIWKKRPKTPSAA